MNSEELKAIQNPIKERFKNSPERALIKLRAEAEGLEGVSCRVNTYKGEVEAGLHPATGGSGQLACSGDMLLESLVACAGVTLQAVATAFGANLSKAKISAEGALDFRGTLGVSQEIPVGFKEISLTFDIAGDVSDDILTKIIQITEKYCVVLQTLRSSPEIETSLNISE